MTSCVAFEDSNYGRRREGHAVNWPSAISKFCFSSSRFKFPIQIFQLSKCDHKIQIAEPFEIVEGRILIEVPTGCKPCHIAILGDVNKHCKMLCMYVCYIISICMLHIRIYVYTACTLIQIHDWTHTCIHTDKHQILSIYAHLNAVLSPECTERVRLMMQRCIAGKDRCRPPENV